MLNGLTRSTIKKYFSVSNLSLEEKKVRLTNWIACILIGCATPYFFIFYLVATPLLGIMIIPIILTLSFVIFLNKKGFRRLSGTLLILCSNMTILFYSTSLLEQSRIQLVYFALVIIPFIIFSSKQFWVRLFGIALPIVLSFYTEVVDYKLFPTVIIQNSYYTIIYHTILVVNFSIIIMIVHFYSKSLEDKEVELKVTSDKVSEKEKLIKDFNKEIMINKKGGIMQFQLLPQVDKTPLKNFRCAYYYKPAFHIGGDYIDLVVNNGLCIASVIDAAGKGASAGLITFYIHAKIQEAREKCGDDIEAIVDYVDQKLAELNVPFNAAAMLTFRVDDDKRQLSFVNAGLVQPFYVDAKNKRVIQLEEASYISTGFTDKDGHCFGGRKASQPMTLEMGSKFIAITDGGTDLRNENNTFLENEGLKAIFKKHMSLGAKSFVEAVVKDFNTFQGKADQKDDIALLVIESLAA